MKSINQYFDFLYSLERTRMKYDLTNIRRLCRAMGNPQNSFKSIHIAGTNGKGATASFAASVLMEHGIKTGLFTSPHVLNFNERIRVNGKQIPTAYVKRFLDKHSVLIKKIKPSFFEVNTAMAFKYFADKNVEAAVIECGLGGRLDSTNIIMPEVSVITPIGMDHMQFLGNTLKKIALEKIGIYKPGVKVIVSDSNKELRPLFFRSIKKSDIVYLKDLVKVTSLQVNKGGLEFILKDKHNKLKLTSPLPGSYQSANAAAAYMAVKEFCRKAELPFDNSDFARGIENVKKNTGYFGRLEIQKIKGKRFIFDASHNAHGISHTVSSLAKLVIKPGIVVFGIMSDKDYNSAIKELLKLKGHFIFTRPEYSRSLDPFVLAAESMKLNSGNKYSVAGNAKEVLRLLNDLKSGTVLVIGSFFLVSDMLKVLGIKKLP